MPRRLGVAFARPFSDAAKEQGTGSCFRVPHLWMSAGMGLLPSTARCLGPVAGICNRLGMDLVAVFLGAPQAREGST